MNVGPLPSPAAGVATATAASAATADWSYVRCPAPITFDYMTERYYHQFCLFDCKARKGNNCRILQHSNGLCVLCLDPSHELVQRCAETTVAGTTISVSKVEFCKGRTPLTPDSIQVIGKRKKNALVCQTETKLCDITLSDGTQYPIPACLNGFVLEFNATLLEQPWMVAASPTVEGYLAVINPTAKADFSGYKKVWTATCGDTAGEAED